MVDSDIGEIAARWWYASLEYGNVDIIGLIA